MPTLFPPQVSSYRYARWRRVKIAAKKMNERLNVPNSHGVVSCLDSEKSVPAASEFIGRQFRIKNRFQIYNRANMLKVQWHNHSLNLTEPAVDDFARAKIGVTIGRDIPRAEWIPFLRRFPPQVSSVPLASKTNGGRMKHSLLLLITFLTIAGCKNNSVYSHRNADIKCQHRQ